ncbi:protelomerase family protein [Gloeothece verrucosa]|uniref:Telomere resolvase ResT/TelK catalytic domain-containing protein n=1 Tax=Gloeothece verrucosa (strain PCC 7822) TaxID=497965 RepID=E0UM46_GLOV7|nr:protelomerase family protein [Gloeothece verrucosa]ADN18026.1 hypothetical protein Cyan7822_6219 [Gloeothece verrucosa PCC 7822]
MPRSNQPKLPDATQIEQINQTIKQLGTQTVRDKVVAAYNQRLDEIESASHQLTPDDRARKRFRKLSNDELLMLALTFVANLIEMNKGGTDTEEKVKELCEAETALLERGYPQETIAKNHHPLYVNLVNAAIYEGQLTLNEQNSYSFDIYKQSGELETITAHYAQLYLKYDREFYRQVKQQSNERNNIKQDTPKPVRLYPYLDKIKELLQSEHHTELAAAIAAATGRRFSEVIERGTFVIPDKPSSAYELIFSGQLKKATEAPAYSTYSIVPAALVVAALYKLRSIPKIAALKGATVQKINTLLPTVNYQIKRHFMETGIVEVLEGEINVTVHNLRGIYGAIAAHFFCPNLAQFPRFLSQQLGHLIGDEAVDSNLSRSTEHYFHYYLVAENGYKIEAMGIKLDEPQPLSSFVELAEQFIESDDEWCKLTGVIAATGVAPDDLLKHYIYKEVANTNTILYTEQLHAPNTPYYKLITLVEAQLVWDTIISLKNHPELKPYLDTHTGKQTLAYVRERIADYLGQLGVETYQLAIDQYKVLAAQLGIPQEIETPGGIDELETKTVSIKTVAWVKKELEQFKAILGTSTHNETLIEIIQLARQALAAQENQVEPHLSVIGDERSSPSIDGDTNLTDESAPFEIIPPPPTTGEPTSSTGELSVNGDNPPVEPTEPIISVAEEITESSLERQTENAPLDVINSIQELDIPLTPPITTTNDSALNKIVDYLAALNSRFDRFFDSFAAPTHHRLTSSNVDHPPPRRTRGSAATEKRITSAIDALMNYNAGVDYQRRWYISAPVIKSLAGGAQVTINETLKNRKDELDAHHQSLGLRPQHNRSFHQGHNITDFVTVFENAHY